MLLVQSLQVSISAQFTGIDWPSRSFPDLTHVKRIPKRPPFFFPDGLSQTDAIQYNLMCPGDMPRKGPLASYFGLTEDQQREHVHVALLIGFHRGSTEVDVRIRV